MVSEDLTLREIISPSKGTLIGALVSSARAYEGVMNSHTGSIEKAFRQSSFLVFPVGARERIHRM
jgi:hypothetical protein